MTAIHAAEQGPSKVLVFALEMSGEETTTEGLGPANRANSKWPKPVRSNGELYR